MSEQSSNKRIAKNTVMLYIRMLISMVVGLYTSRVVLQTLGVEDYGIYGVVGGVVSMMGFLNASMAGATSRFITFELGKGDMQRVRDTFSSALIVHMIIALIIVVVGETAGLWFLCNKLVIPEERMAAAHWVYQFSIISAAIGVTQAPYSAVIMSHEKMDIYAYFELLNVGLKLGIVYLLLIGNFDKLILYALLTFIVSLFMRFLYRIYCIRHYDESHFKLIWNIPIIKSITSFSLYNLFGNMGWYVNNQGTSFIINIFFGVAYNAAASIATTLSNVVNSFASNIMTAFRPSVTKAYARGNFIEFENLLNLSIKTILTVYSLIALPVFISVDSILQFWLVKAPLYANVFCRLMLISLYWEIFKQLVVMGIHACGRVRIVSLMSGIMYCINPIVIFICFRFGLSVGFAYVSAIFMHMIVGTVDVFIMKREIKNISIGRCFMSLASVTLAVVLSFILCMAIPSFTNDNKFLCILMNTLSAVVVLLVLLFTIVLNSSQRNQLIALITNKIKG